MRTSIRSATELSGVWKFDLGDTDGAAKPDFDDTSWSNVRLPHAWDIAGAEDPAATTYSSGVGWYRCHYTARPGDSGKRVYLQFDGANRVADVFVNGTPVGTHRGGYSGFVFEITPLLRFGRDNLIAVKVSNAHDPEVSPLSGDFVNFGGLYRTARILVLDPVHITPLDYGGPGVYLRTSDVSAEAATLQVTSKVRNDTDSPRQVIVRTRVVDAAGNPVRTLVSTQDIAAGADSSFVQETTIEKPHLWNGRPDPYLYRAIVEVHENGEVRDAVTQPLGFRSFRIDRERGFYLNGQPYDLHGFCLHEQRLGKGNAISDDDRAQDMGDVVESGATFVRLVHYQHAPHTYRLADENGVVLWTEIGFIEKATDSAAFHDNLMDQLRELIRQNCNHPSVCFWGLANEIAAGAVQAADLRDLHDLAHREDPTRPTTEATNQSGSSSVDFVADVQGFNRYYSWYAGANAEFGSFLDNMHATASRPIGISEYGAGAGIHQHEDDPAPPEPWGPWHPEEYQNTFHESTWPQFASRPYLWSKAIWVLYDFSSRGRMEGELNGYNDKGLVTADHQTRKDAFYYYKAQWSTTPFAYITSRRFEVRTEKQTTAKVYSNCDTVEMFLNGVSLGTQKGTSDHRFSVPITLVSGANTFTAIGTRNGATYTDTVQWQGAPALDIRVAQPASEPVILDTPGVLPFEVSVLRDGATPGAETHYRWTQVGGNGEVIFADPTSTKTTARVSAVGAYVMRLAVTDDTSSKARDFQVVVDPGVTLKTGLLGHWNFDETSGNMAADASGGGRDIRFPAADWTTDGKMNGALLLNGSDAGGSFASEETSRITVAAWIKPTDAGDDEQASLVDLPGYRLYLSKGDHEKGIRVGFDARTGRGKWHWRTESDLPGKGAWIHLAVTYERTTTTPPVCYVNGVAVKLKVQGRGWDAFATNAGTGYIGNSPEGNCGFHGSVDELRIYNRILTSGEIALLAAGAQK